MKRSLITLAIFAAMPALAQETRQMEAHVHGVSELDIAMEGDEIVLDLHAPGADIVGFEYPAASDEEKDAVEAAILAFTRPAEIFTPSPEAECRVSEVLTHLHGGEHHHEDADEHMEHGHEGHEHGEHKEEHAEGEHDHDDHKDEHAEGEHDHDDHKDEGEHKHEEGHEHEGEHAEGAMHSEFHARMAFECEHPEKLTTVALPFFEVFPLSKELHIAIVSDHGAQVIEAERGQTSITIEH